MNIRVKICGITSFEDAMVAVEAGADALGFVFYEKSPRFIDFETAASIIDRLPPFVERVGLFVNQSSDVVNEVCQKVGLSSAQIHFDVDMDYLESLNVKYLPVVRAKEPKDLLKFSSSYRLVDAYCESFGGAGKRLNIEWFKDIDCSKVILAGGLTPDNVVDVVRLGFYGVDVSSGVEIEKGKKDPKKVRDFIKRAKEAVCAL